MLEKAASPMWETEVAVLPAIPDDQFWWLALVQLEKAPKQTLLADEEEGAYVWVAAVAKDRDDVDRLIRRAAKSEGLRVVSIDDHSVVEDLEEIEDVDENLASDVAESTLEDQPLLWGTWHVYYGDGEA
ncbi:MAG: hypothetical protein ACFCUN_02380 [Hyphomicrobiaceae bacterium]